ncbi:DoxX family protein [Nonomuraea cavernae]|uniref:DoxX family protein n=1 Tax=Nonomuraea cavernae TaxID=2045107 RepID=UPI0033EAE9CF
MRQPRQRSVGQLRQLTHPRGALLAALGLVLPAALGIVPILTPLTATGLVLLMIGAAVTHARRKETPAIAVNVVLLVLAAIVAWGRFGPA